MSKESIVEKILSDAKTKANSFVREQNAKANEIIADAAEQCKTYIYEFKAETDKMSADIDSRSRAVAELEVRKVMLAAKTRLLDGVFSRAVEKLRSLDDKTMTALLIGMLDVAAEDGDVITLGERQKSCLTSFDVWDFAKNKGISLTLSSEYGNFDGMILSSGGVEKNLTFDVEVALAREDMQTQIAKEMFD